MAVLSHFVVVLSFVSLSFFPNACLAASEMNAIDQCWKLNTIWRRSRQQLATCSVGFAGKMANNVGRDVILYKATDVIIHGLRIHHCKAHSQMDGDAIRLVSASKVWIDHNTLFSCQDGLLDVTRGSTFVTVSNNWFRDQDKVMLLGHDDGFLRDKDMKVTVAFNHFGPNCNQRMPRVRHGYAHVTNNLYQGWEQYAIGGSMSPSIKSESNYFIAPKSGKKEVTWRNGIYEKSKPWNFYSVGDLFTNGASFFQSGRRGMARPNYTKEQSFKVGDAKSVKTLTSSAGALKCSRTLRC
uniref:Pectate lyase domain-containing protein n=1 Tax=Populus trichocarpa TaxID=3694 RepID=A0A2K2ACI2_POPTR